MSFLILIIGFALLIKGADVFVEGASSIAKRFNVPSMIIGLTIVAMGTSAPEAAVSITASLKGMNDISIGNNLRNLRNAANLTQEQVVAQLQLRNLPTTRSIYSQIEAGTYNIKIRELIALTEIFHTDFNTIFDGLSYDK